MFVGLVGLSYCWCDDIQVWSFWRDEMLVCGSFGVSASLFGLVGWAVDGAVGHSAG